LLRKAIRLALLYPREKKYQRFLDEFVALYRDAKWAAADRRLGAAGRQERVTDLENRLCELCPAVPGRDGGGVAAAGAGLPQPGERINGSAAG